MPENTFIDTILSPPALLTFIVCALVASIIWFINGVHRGNASVSWQTSVHQEATPQRLLDTVVKDKDEVLPSTSNACASAMNGWRR